MALFAFTAISVRVVGPLTDLALIPFSRPSLFDLAGIFRDTNSTL